MHHAHATVFPLPSNDPNALYNLFLLRPPMLFHPRTRILIRVLQISQRRNLSAELGANELSLLDSCGGGIGSATGNLHRNNSTERTGSRWVDKFDQADT